MTLYELSNEYADAVAAYEAAETEEEAQAMLQKLMELGGDVQEKGKAYAKIMRNAESDINALEAEKKRLDKMCKSRKALIARLKLAMLAGMETMKVKSIDTGVGKWTTQKNPWSCEVTNADAVPERFKSYRTECDIDKKAMIEEFKATGEDFEGVTIEQKLGVRFR